MRPDYGQRRAIVWRTLWEHHFRRLVRPEDCVLDLGSGHCDFINSVAARRRIALDHSPEVEHCAAAGVEAVVGCVTGLDFLADRSVDVAFASNLFEHLTRAEVAACLAALRPKLVPGGSLVIVQPNWRHAHGVYFDDPTHITAWSDRGLAAFLLAAGWQVIEVVPRFMPYSINSAWPVAPWLIRAWLASPLRPFARQMLVRARPRPGAA